MTAIAANNTPVNSVEAGDMEDIENIITVPGEPRPLKEIIAEVQATNEPRLLTLGGQPQMVCLSVAAYRAMEAKIDYWETVQAIREAHEQSERGQTRPAREALEELGVSMAFFVDLTEMALANAHDALAWMEDRSPDNAAEWYAGLIEAIYSLEEMPRRCAFAPENDEAVVEVRQLLYTKRRVTYRILFVITQEESDKQDGSVRIYHIRHGAQGPLTAAERRRLGTD